MMTKPPQAPHFWSGAEDVRNTTIERCAQVAEKYDYSTKENEFIPTHEMVCERIAAAIRKLKDAPPVDPNIIHPGKDPDFVFPGEEP